MAEAAAVATPEKGSLEESILGKIAQLQEGLDDKHKTQEEKFAIFKQQIEEIREDQAELKKQQALGGGLEFGGVVRSFDGLETFDLSQYDGRSAKQRVLMLEGQVEPTVKVGQSSEAVDLIKLWQEAADRRSMAVAIAKFHEKKGWVAPDVKMSRAYQEFGEIDRELQKALNTGTGNEGGDWVPPGFSAQMAEKIALELRVAAQFDTFPMPTNPYTYPFETTHPVAQRVAESATAVNPFDGLEAARAFGNPAGNVPFNAQKLRCLEVLTRELSDDSIPEAIRHLERAIPRGLARGRETAVINGDTTPNASSGHIDSDIAEADASGVGAEILFTGLRKRAETVGANAKQDLGTFSTANLRLQRKKMGVYGVVPSDLRWFASVSSMFALMNNVDVLTVDKYGPGATILSGEIGRFDGIPIILSEFVRNDLNALGVYDGVTTNKTILILAHVESFRIGTRPGRGLETERLKFTDSEMLIAFDRADFQALTPATDVNVTVGYNIAS